MPTLPRRPFELVPTLPQSPQSPLCGGGGVHGTCEWIQGEERSGREVGREGGAGDRERDENGDEAAGHRRRRRSLGVGGRTSASTRRRLSGSGVGQANVGVGVRVATQSQRRLACARPVSGAMERTRWWTCGKPASCSQPSTERRAAPSAMEGKVMTFSNRISRRVCGCQCRQHVANELEVARPVPGATE